MSSGFIIRLRPAGPWRFGPSSGARDRVDRIFHSDSLYSGLTHAMLQLGKLDEWLAATATAQTPAVRLSSCFPFLGEMLLATPPRGTWPPPVSTKVRWKGARFVPLQAIATLLKDKPLDDDRWIVDPESECLLPVEKNVAPSSPFRVTVRTAAAVDRTGHGNLELHSTACLEFAEGAGLWCAAMFADEACETQWSGPLRAAFRLLADSGVGGERSRGWGRSAQPDFRDLSELGLNASGDSTAYWLLSVYTPAADDQVDWQRGNYSLITRGGRIESAARWGGEKQLLRMVEEGSVIFAGASPKGAAKNVAPDGFPHPVYRAGFALAIAIPWKGSSAEKPRAAEVVPEPKTPEPPSAPPFEYEPIAVEAEPVEPEPETAVIEYEVGLNTVPEPEVSTPSAETGIEEHATEAAAEFQMPAELEPQTQIATEVHAKPQVPAEPELEGQAAAEVRVEPQAPVEPEPEADVATETHASAEPESEAPTATDATAEPQSPPEPGNPEGGAA